LRDHVNCRAGRGILIEQVPYPRSIALGVLLQRALRAGRAPSARRQRSLACAWRRPQRRAIRATV